jgi:hypothetical protein
MVGHPTFLQAHHSSDFFPQKFQSKKWEIFGFLSVNLRFFKRLAKILIVTVLKIKTLLAKSSIPPHNSLRALFSLLAHENISLY